MEWLEPWHPIKGEPDQAVAMERELQREIADGHALHGLPMRALARRHDRDDVLFMIDDGSGRVAVVHLTWTSAPPDRPPWPSCAVFTSLEAWRAEVIRPDHDEFCDS